MVVFIIWEIKLTRSGCDKLLSSLHNSITCSYIWIIFGESNQIKSKSTV